MRRVFLVLVLLTATVSILAWREVKLSNRIKALEATNKAQQAQRDLLGKHGIDMGDWMILEPGKVDVVCHVQLTEVGHIIQLTNCR